jgi:hypothetical protein
MIPSISRDVHYVSYGIPGEYASGCRAAKVTAVLSLDDSPRVSLFVMSPNGVFFDLDVRQDEDGHADGTWHWPERVPE